MRTICVCAFVFSTLFFIACKKGDTGSQGPQGQTGPQGPSGPQGNTGNANVIYSDWLSVNFSDWKDTVMTNIPRCQRIIKTASALTQSLLDSGVVLAYLKDTVTTNVYPLPFTYNINPARVHGFLPLAGKILFYEYSTDGTGGATTIRNKYRYILIPGGVKTNGRTVNPNNISYEEVCDMYKIPR